MKRKGGEREKESKRERERERNHTRNDSEADLVAGHPPKSGEKKVMN